MQIQLVTERHEQFLSHCAHLSHFLEHSSKKVKQALGQGFIVGYLRGRDETRGVEI
jgi:hypothetical protein